VKIDREFVADLGTSRSSRHVVGAVVALSQNLGHQTIAEGVEDEATAVVLRELGVDLAQGYLFGRPAPA
jgi:EAL domain-containing protein (putative c-di-GMP-specific phosphodiesterase class I)